MVALASKGDWTEVRMEHGGGESGWILTSLLRRAEPAAVPAEDKISAQVNANGVNGRTAPSIKAPVQLQLFAQRSVWVLEQRGQWSRIVRSDGLGGDVWVASRFLTQESAPQVARAAQSVAQTGLAAGEASAVLREMVQGAASANATPRSAQNPVKREQNKAAWLEQEMAATPLPQPLLSQVRLENAELMASPRVDAEIIAKLTYNQKAWQLARRPDNWVQVRLEDGTRGWIWAPALVAIGEHEQETTPPPQPDRSAESASDAANQAGAESPKQQSGGAAALSKPADRERLTHLDSPQPIPAQAAAGAVVSVPQAVLPVVQVHDTALRVRFKPALDAGVMAGMQPGQQGWVLSRAPQWVEVLLADGHHGWVAAEYLRQTPPQQIQLDPARLSPEASVLYARALAMAALAEQAPTSDAPKSQPAPQIASAQSSVLAQAAAKLEREEQNAKPISALVVTSPSESKQTESANSASEQTLPEAVSAKASPSEQAAPEPIAETRERLRQIIKPAPSEASPALLRLADVNDSLRDQARNRLLRPKPQPQKATENAMQVATKPEPDAQPTASPPAQSAKQVLEQSDETLAAMVADIAQRKSAPVATDAQSDRAASTPVVESTPSSVASSAQAEEPLALPAGVDAAHVRITTRAFSNMRRRPNDESTIVGQTHIGDPLQVIETQGEWFKVIDLRPNSVLKGWIWGPLTRPLMVDGKAQAKPRFAVDREQANLRAEPNTEAPIAAQLTRGAWLQATGEVNGAWLAVRNLQPPHQSGWIWSPLLRSQERPPEGVVAAAPPTSEAIAPTAEASAASAPATKRAFAPNDDPDVAELDSMLTQALDLPPSQPPTSPSSPRQAVSSRVLSAAAPRVLQPPELAPRSRAQSDSEAAEPEALVAASHAPDDPLAQLFPGRPKHAAFAKTWAQLADQTRSLAGWAFFSDYAFARDGKELRVLGAPETFGPLIDRYLRDRKLMDLAHAWRQMMQHEKRLTVKLYDPQGQTRMTRRLD
ncbi:putative abhydrolase domain-containing protein [Magnetofaba australis IT-1]|uniref:Putative abhydrolase domain-containing protein n=1 Tax=Magnetofaba australis IT-1 TaxID=1434232 RepID=A0A1Y2K255_9PROT|nr:putative abhydrolase domain-containing protein [Magnetofaba australis IT-1]